MESDELEDWHPLLEDAALRGLVCALALGDREATRPINDWLADRGLATIDDATDPFDFAMKMLPERAAHALACDVAEAALETLPIYSVDPRFRRAIATKRRWLAGEATTDEALAASFGAYAACLEQIAAPGIYRLWSVWEASRLEDFAFGATIVAASYPRDEALLARHRELLVAAIQQASSRASSEGATS